MIAMGLLGLLALALVVGVVTASWLRTPGDSLTVLLFSLSVAFVLPQRFVIVGLDNAGAPGLLIGVFLLGLWVLGRLHPETRLDGDRDVARVVIALFTAMWFFDLAQGAFQPGGAGTTEAIIRRLLSLLSFVGYALYASDALQHPRDVQRLLRGLTILGGLVAAIGLVQFASGIDPLSSLRIPGLVDSPSTTEIRVRSSFVRARGTALHPIEFSVVLAMLLPTTIHVFRTSTTTRWRRTAAACALGCGAAALISVSRSGVLAIVVAVAVASLAWTVRERIRYAAASFVLLVGVYMLAPGLLGTLRGLFANAGNDPSILNRQRDVPIVIGIVEDSPLFGIGDGRITAEDILLDNEFYGRLISSGVAGVVLFSLMFVVPAAFAYARSRIGRDETMHSAAIALAAGLATAFVSLATFDGWFFRLYVTVVAVMIASAGAVWRLRRVDPTAIEQSPATSVSLATRRDPSRFGPRRP